jgi:WhiB family transcriptional regulator, redox-sensing transcriptional regulator
MNSPVLADRKLGWLDLGACRDEDPDLFFPIASAGPGLAQVAAAKVVCARCAVRQTCLRFALEASQDYGVWGGLSEEERRAIRNARSNQAECLAG